MASSSSNKDRFISIAEVMRLTSIRSKSTIYSEIKKGRFPRPYAVTEARRAWSANEVAAWIEQRKAAA